MREGDKPGAVNLARDLLELGFNVCATRGTAQVMADAGLDVEVVNKVLEGRPHVVDMLKSDQIQFVVNTTEGRQAINDSAQTRELLANKVCYTTTLSGGEALVSGLKFGEQREVRSLQSLYARSGS